MCGCYNCIGLQTETDHGIVHLYPVFQLLKIRWSSYADNARICNMYEILLEKKLANERKYISCLAMMGFAVGIWRISLHLNLLKSNTKNDSET